jgi:hypothetical protein
MNQSVKDIRCYSDGLTIAYKRLLAFSQQLRKDPTVREVSVLVTPNNVLLGDQNSYSHIGLIDLFVSCTLNTDIIIDWCVYIYSNDNEYLITNTIVAATDDGSVDLREETSITSTTLDGFVEALTSSVRSFDGSETLIHSFEENLKDR